MALGDIRAVCLVNLVLGNSLLKKSKFLMFGGYMYLLFVFMKPNW